MKKIIVLGDGGHSKVVQDIIRALEHTTIFAILDDRKYKELTFVDEIIYGPFSILPELIAREDTRIIIAIGDNNTRKKLVDTFSIDEEKYITLIHPSATVSPSARIGNGTVVMPNCVVNAHALIGNHCIINSGAVVEHDNVIQDYVHISPNSTLTGNVQVLEGTHIGAGSNIIPSKTIGAWSKIGAGATVVNNIPDRCVAVGTPAKIIREF